MAKENYEFSSLYFVPPPELCQDIVSWGRKNIDDNQIFVSQIGPSLGREDDIHVTVLYGIHAGTPAVLKPLLQTQRPVQMQLGRVQIFSNNRCDVVVIDVLSDSLYALHECIKGQTRYTTKHSRFRPHLTIAYVKHNMGWQFYDNRNWEGLTFTCNKLTFASHTGLTEQIMLVP